MQENGYKTHKKWYNNYVKLRDKNIFYLGGSDETFGNQMFQMTYNSSSDDFIIKVRKENHWCKSTIEQAISKIVSYALTKGKDIVKRNLLHQKVIKIRSIIKCCIYLIIVDIKKLWKIAVIEIEFI